MRNQLARHLGPLIAPPGKVGRGGAALVFAAEAAGSAAPTPEFNQREYAVFLLSMAAEVEHSLMVQYLYSAWSLGGPQVPEAHRGEIETWRRIMLGIAKEEMGHLLTVQNLLRLIGGPVHLDREDFPWISGFYPYPFSLEPASRATVAKYVIAESPEIWPASVSEVEKETIEQLATVDATMQIGRVGVLYRKLIAMFGNPQALKDADFRSETYPQQASFDDWGRGYSAGARGAAADTRPDVLALRATNRAQAVYALKQVAEQGEATELLVADQEDSHFMRFLEVWRGLDKALGWSPSLPLPINPTLPGLGAGAVTITNAESAAWGAMFNLRYRMLLTWLGHALNLGASEADNVAPGRRGLALNRVFSEMYCLKIIAGILSRRPLGVDPSEPAGPPFQMPYTLNFPAEEPDFWRLHLDLILAALENAAVLPASGEEGWALLAGLKAADLEAKRDIEAILDGGQLS
jgi:hypothetical protein